MKNLRIKPDELTHAQAVADLLSEVGGNESVASILHRAISDGLRERSALIGKRLVKSGNYRKAFLPK